MTLTSFSQELAFQVEGITYAQSLGVEIVNQSFYASEYTMTEAQIDDALIPYISDAGLRGSVASALYGAGLGASGQRMKKCYGCIVGDEEFMGTAAWFYGSTCPYHKLRGRFLAFYDL